ncbi:DMT family transporter [Ramlibacter tataouinensis]|uniref:Candidate Permeases of the drug/metabolite transporter (DMT) superfamily n=1 Tax=Ramlibacter tataouinensis (strain ATCC BAA-407 / DSM 14655 / LMG 21543 / TTB310) TaxID=365046 RepID=F5Y3Y3_RAMTT|nr:EamA family transporter [Ramlibacter tataouinensis]AEG91261.1 Candidate Permeases of the drug/metabolite transporter (DMT) superfamily [Ramlibacter tataouinensis TTB310]
MPTLSRQQAVLLVLLTLAWGLNWPVMKLGVTEYPPLGFRAMSMWLGLPLLALALVVLKVPFGLPRRHWPELLWLTAANMLVWHVCIILALRTLSGGRAAILGYTMPIFSAVIGALLFSTRLSGRAWLGVGAAALGVVLLLWHELTGLAGRPAGVGLALVAAATWALGTQLLRRTRLPVPTLALAFWMTVLTAVAITVLALVFEGTRWRRPNAPAAWAIAYNAVLIFGFAQAAWFTLARGLPPVASTLSVMFIPVLGVFSGALWLGERLHWQDWAAVGLMVVAIGSVLWPARPALASSG